MNTGNAIHCNCNGTGRYIVKEAPGGECSIGDGLTLVSMGSITTHPCPCRMNLPKRYGQATWWSTEHVKTMEYRDPFIQVEASISNELPMSEDNYRLHRTEENCHYPAMAEIDGLGNMLMSSTLRDFAKWLLEVADEVDKANEPVEDQAASEVSR